MEIGRVLHFEGGWWYLNAVMYQVHNVVVIWSVYHHHAAVWRAHAAVCRTMVVYLSCDGFSNRLLDAPQF